MQQGSEQRQPSDDALTETRKEAAAIYFAFGRGGDEARDLLVGIKAAAEQRGREDFDHLPVSQMCQLFQRKMAESKAEGQAEGARAVRKQTQERLRPWLEHKKACQLPDWEDRTGCSCGLWKALLDAAPEGE